MAYKADLRFGVATAGMRTHARAVLDAIDAAAKYSAELTDAQGGDTTLAWSRVLFGTANTGNVTLTVNATAKTISCTAGAGLFANHRVGRDVQITGFSTNPGNNQTTEITGQTDDNITIANATGLVDETDDNAKVQENTTAEEQAAVTALIAAHGRFAQLKDALDNSAVTTADRRSDLVDWVW